MRNFLFYFITEWKVWNIYDEENSCFPQSVPPSQNFKIYKTKFSWLSLKVKFLFKRIQYRTVKLLLLSLPTIRKNFIFIFQSSINEELGYRIKINYFTFRSSTPIYFLSSNKNFIWLFLTFNNNTKAKYSAQLRLCSVWVEFGWACLSLFELMWA